MKRLCIGCLGFLIISGCGGTGALEMEVKQLRNDMYSQMRSQTNSVREDLQKEMRSMDNNLQNEINEIKDVHKKDTFEINKNLVDHQKQIFNSKAILEDASKRIYLLETIMTSKAPAVAQIKEGFITFVSGDEVSISLGGVHGIKTGDQLSVYRDADKIGAIEIDVVEANSSKGKVVRSVSTVSIGDRIEK